MKIQSNDYSIYFDSEISRFQEVLEDIKPSSLFILVDQNSRKFCLEDLYGLIPESKNASIIEIRAGENFKNLESASQIWSELFKKKADRKSLLINLGGGVITDIGAFAASTYKRGIRFIQVPTTLLSMVDASVGGKTGIDFQGEKNMIGTFCSPLSVLIHSSFLKSLDHAQLKAGISEMLKHGLIADRGFYRELKQKIQEGKLEEAVHISKIYRSIEIKNQIVLEDPYEKGVRKLLNFGHTIGHALETFSLISDSNPLNHGEAIAMGMVCESYLSSVLGDLPENELSDIIPPLKSLFPSKKIETSRFQRLYEYMLNDKKNDGGLVNFTLLQKIGHGLYNKTASEKEIFESLAYFNSILDNSY